MFIWKFGSCPENSDFSYLQILSREGLPIPSINLVKYVCTAFTILDYSVDVITQLPPGIAAERILCHFPSDNLEEDTCSMPESIGWLFCKSVVANVFFNNKRKLSTDSAVVIGVKAFKKRQREM